MNLEQLLEHTASLPLPDHPRFKQNGDDWRFRTGAEKRKPLSRMNLYELEEAIAIALAAWHDEYTHCAANNIDQINAVLNKWTKALHHTRDAIEEEEILLANPL